MKTIKLYNNTTNPKQNIIDAFDMYKEDVIWRRCFIVSTVISLIYTYLINGTFKNFLLQVLLSHFFIYYFTNYEQYHKFKPIQIIIRKNINHL